MSRKGKGRGYSLSGNLGPKSGGYSLRELIGKGWTKPRGEDIRSQEVDVNEKEVGTKGEQRDSLSSERIEWILTFCCPILSYKGGREVGGHKVENQLESYSFF